MIAPMLDATFASFPVDTQMNLSCCGSAIFLPRSLCRDQKPDRPSIASKTQCLLFAVQKRALLTYIQRVYYPSVVREPELVQLDYGHLAVWLHTSPFDITTSSLFLSMAVVIPALNHLPSALAQAEDVVSQLCKSPGLAKLPIALSCCVLILMRCFLIVLPCFKVRDIPRHARMFPVSC